MTRHNIGLVYGGNRHGAFQLYTALRDRAIAKLPDAIPYSHGAVMPLAISTSIAGLFDTMGLDYALVYESPLAASIHRPFTDH